MPGGSDVVASCGSVVTRDTLPQVVDGRRTHGTAPSTLPAGYYGGRVGLLGWIVTGFAAGVLARWVVRDDRSGCLLTIVIGVLGALIGGGLMSAIDERGVDEFSLRSILVAFVGACLLLLVLQALGGGARRRHRR